MKQKTKSAARKRFTFSSTGKAKRRTVNQAHFNARETGSDTRKKHHDKPVSISDKRRLVRLLPYG